MKYTQKKNKNFHTFKFEDNGITYTIKDESLNKEVFIPFENITNNTHEVYEKNMSYRNNAIYTAVIGVIFLLINIIYQTRLWAWLFLLSAPIFYWLYNNSKVTYKVIKVENEIDIYLIKAKEMAEINDEIFKQRNQYLRTKYGEINPNNNADDEIRKFQWLKNLGVFSKREFEVISDSILNE
jgi:hypothetical protein